MGGSYLLNQAFNIVDVIYAFQTVFFHYFFLISFDKWMPFCFLYLMHMTLTDTFGPKFFEFLKEFSYAFEFKNPLLFVALTKFWSEKLLNNIEPNGMCYSHLRNGVRNGSINAPLRIPLQQWDL